MRLIPAIDLRDGACVRLYQGDYEQTTQYNPDPVGQAKLFEAAGASDIHLVDLDAARAKTDTELATVATASVNRQVIANICEAVSIPVQVGGGVRSVEAAAELFSLGVDKVILGTAAVENPGLVLELCEAGHKVIVGLDARDGFVATHGWETLSDRPLLDLAKEFDAMNIAGLVVTEIERDGTLQGPATELYSQLLAEINSPIIASGGVGSLSDLGDLVAVRNLDGRGIDGVIVGKALYENKFDVSEALVELAGKARS